MMSCTSWRCALTETATTGVDGKANCLPYHACKRLSYPFGPCQQRAAVQRLSTKSNSHAQSVSISAAEPTDGQDSGAGPEPEGQEGTSGPGFDWHRAWYPAAPVSHLHHKQPNPVTLLGARFVVWLDERNEWRAAADACPHRLTPLSEGLLEDGFLQDRYHGWTFNGAGQCIACPQANAELEVIIVKGDQHNLETFPTTVRQGLVWLWPSSSRTAFLDSAASPAPCSPEVVASDWAGSNSDWNMNEVPCGWLMVAENALDPSHAPFLHDGVLFDRKHAAPMSMSRVTDGHWPPQAKVGFSLEHGGYTRMQQEDGMRAVRSFQPPCTVRLDYKFASGRKLVCSYYIVPVEPGVTRAIGKFVFQVSPGQLSWPVAKLYNLGHWFLALFGLLHAFTHSIVDQDVVMLHAQERELAARHNSWRSYRLPTPSDTGVDTFWHWLEQAGGDIPWAGGKSSFKDLPPRLTRSQLTDHHARHTQFCPGCKQALKRISSVRLVLLVVGAFSLASIVLGSLPPLPILLLGITCVVLRCALGYVREMFFCAPLPPGHGWRNVQYHVPL